MAALMQKTATQTLAHQNLKQKDRNFPIFFILYTANLKLTFSVIFFYNLFIRGQYDKII